MLYSTFYVSKMNFSLSFFMYLYQGRRSCPGASCLFILCHLPAYFADDNATLIDRMEGVGHNGHYDFEFVNF